MYRTNTASVTIPQYINSKSSHNKGNKDKETGTSQEERQGMDAE